MNQLFDAGRWWLLVRKHWSDNRKKYILSLIAAFGLLLLWFISILLSDPYGAFNASMQNTTFYFGLFIAGCLYGSTLFSDLDSKTRGLNYLLVPGSHLEKLLCSLFYGVLVFFISYMAIFYCVDVLMIKVSNAIAYNQWLKDHMPGAVFTPGKVFNVFATESNRHDMPEVMLYLLLFYFVVQSAFIYGSVYFSKFGFIKTIIALLVAGVIIVFVLSKIIVHILPPGNYQGINGYEVYASKEIAGGATSFYRDEATDKLVTIPEWISKALLFLLKFAFAPLFWLATYFRLKEKAI